MMVLRTHVVFCSERYYSVYDARNRKVGFAPTKYTHAEIN